MATINKRISTWIWIPKFYSWYVGTKITHNLLMESSREPVFIFAMISMNVILDINEIWHFLT